MDYLIKASAILIIFYLFYKLLLQKETFFQLNRVFLLVGLISSALLPLIVIPIYVEIPTTNFTDLNSTYGTTNTTVEKSIDWIQIITYLYIGGLIIFSSKLIISSYSLLMLFLKSSNVKKIDGISYIETTDFNSPFSIFNYIVHNPTMFTKDELEQILIHERVHVKQQHSIDIFSSEIIKTVFWFNPFVWMYKKDIHQNLEYIADSTVIKQTETTTDYQHLLLKTCSPNYEFSLTNNFFNSLIKKRITMLHKSKSKKTNLIKYTLVIPILVVFIFNFNTKVIAQSAKGKTEKFTISGKSDAGVIINLKDTDNPLIIIDGTESNKSELEKFAPDSLIAINFLKGDSAIKKYGDKGKEGIIEIKTKQNTPTKIGMNTMDFQFKDKFQYEPSKISRIFISKSSRGENPPLYYVDGELYSIKQMNELNQNNIESVSVVKDAAAGNKYGDKGKNGVVLITTKNNQKIKVIGYKNPNHTNKTYFGFQTDQSKTNETISQKNKIIIQGGRGSNGKKPLLIIDGKETSKKIEDLNADNFFSVNIIKDKGATDKYGDKGKNGVIEIITHEKYIVTTANEDIVTIENPVDNNIEIEFSNSENNPLYIVNGKERSYEKTKKINPKKIKSMTILKDASANEKYGDKGKNGVIEITTKKKK